MPLLVIHSDQPLPPALEAALESAGLNATRSHVRTGQNFAEALTLGEFASAIYYSPIPDNGYRQVLKSIRERRPFLPFILVCDEMTEAEAVEAIRGGACDCIAMPRIERLPSAIHAAVREQRAEMERIMQQEQDRLALEVAQAGRWWFEPADNQSWCDLRHSQIFGYDGATANWNRDLFYERVLPEDRALIEQSFSHAYRTGTDWEVHARIRRVDGEVRWIWLKGRFDTRFRPKRMYGITTDVTERVATHLESVVNADRFKTLVEQASVGINIGDFEGSLSYVNPSLLSLLGYTNEDLQQGRLRWDQLTPAEYAEADARAMKQLRDTGACEPYEKQYFTRDGRRIPLLMGAVTIPSRDGSRDEIAVFVTDLTSLKETEKNLQESRAELQRQLAEMESVYKTAPIGLALFDPVEFRYLNLNDRQAEIVGLPKSEILGKTLTEIAPIEGLREMFEQVARGEPIRNSLLEGELPMTPGVHRYWTVNYFPVYGPDGKVQAITAASLEITAQKRAELALIQSEKIAAVGRLASSISHEINNPLESVTNLLFLAMSSPELPHTSREYLELAEKELSRVSQIVNQTLRFHRQPTKATKVRPTAIMNSVLALYQGRLMNSRVFVEQQVRSTHELLCFEGEVRQVFNNLVANAIDAMRGGGKLLLRFREATNWKTGKKGITVCVADTGQGMSAATRKRLFEPFYTTKGISGTGLGLWISGEIVKNHGGRILVRSSDRAGCSGTVFSCFFPYREEPISK